ncbi:MAG: WXG100 family type VII secretion target [Solobacterium sp.]|nr:WXG100 family type VII secretion target [Solobacterium sp.]
MATMDSNQLRTDAGTVRSVAANFQTELTRLGSVVTSTKEYWQDEAQVSFEERYVEFKATMDKYLQALDNYSKAMDAYANHMDETRQSGKSMFDSMSQIG